MESYVLELEFKNVQSISVRSISDLLLVKEIV
jgi:hypothetical protein